MVAFAESQVYSIDSFLAKLGRRNLPERQKYFTALGKFLIAFFIRDYEISNRVGFQNFDWIQHIINLHLSEGLEIDAFFSNPPKIITFNYDTFFERSLVAHMIRYHGYPAELAIDMVKSLNIVHVYGSVQSIANTSEDEIVFSSMDSIKVIGEERSSDAISDLIGKELEKCKNVYFLGFGFDPENCDLLFQNYDCHKGDILGTKFHSTRVGLTEHDMFEIDEFLRTVYGVEVDFKKGHVNNVDCMELIRVITPIFSEDVIIGC